MKESKSLYSSDISSVVEGDSILTGLKEDTSPGNIPMSIGSDESLWYYIFVHHSRLEKVNTKLEERFKTFIHKTLIYSKNEGRVKSIEKPTIPGLLFVKGKLQEIQHFLNEKFSGIYLATDRTTKQVAFISDKEMQSFIRLSSYDGPGIRILEKPFEYYSSGNQLVRITSGILKGSEGYIVRISREKCLVTRFGNITVAICGVTKESFEKIDDSTSIGRQ